MLHSDLHCETYMLSSFVAHSTVKVEADTVEIFNCKVIAQASLWSCFSATWSCSSNMDLFSH